MSAHVHPDPAAGPGPAAVAAAAAAVLGVAVYLLAARRLRRRGDRWPRWRDGSFSLGGAGVASAANLPLPGGPYTAHMVQHLVLGMAAPLLLVLARPLTLALRTAGPGRPRRGLVALSRSRPVHWLVFPPLAALLDIGGLWLLYRTRLFAATQDTPWVHALVHAHVLAAGLLFSFAVCRLDPVRRRWGVAVRGGSLLAAGAAHAVLAKTLYAQPPPGTAFAAADLQMGAQVMYYGGDLVEAALAAVVAASWYRARHRPARYAARALSGRAGGRRWDDEARVGAGRTSGRASHTPASAG
ncbi:cytochrome c oxidase assembly protein [Streptomyces sp. NRRL F-2664]|uniref:cytochrome c oxidase assembly protein n=1 Tax=Streptomyces sp. NRRL F-2664 TaxID=1463842 RepID=UPI0007C7E835|nr:cytochrome c oxidase assembly protein [Streptomyces sp. NRRL F-2664]